MCSVRTGLQGKYKKEFCCANDYVVDKWPFCDAYIFRKAYVSCLLGNQLSVVVFSPSRQTLGSSLPKMA